MMWEPLKVDFETRERQGESEGGRRKVEDETNEMLSGVVRYIYMQTQANRLFDSPPTSRQYCNGATSRSSSK